jgi:hypothetical protein
VKPLSRGPFAVHPLLPVLCLAALVLRLAWGLSRPADDAAIDPLPDQRGYLEAGRNLLSGAGLWYVDERFGQRVYAVRTPGYPALVALCGGSVRAVRVVQSIVDASTALAIYLLTRRLLRGRARDPGTAAAGDTPARDPNGARRSCGDVAPLVACVLVAFNPFLVYFSALLLTETLYTAMLAWAMVLLLARRGWPWGVLLLALGIHVRPAGIGLPLALGVAAAWVRLAGDRQPGERPARPAAGRRVVVVVARTLAAGALAAALTVAVLLPWAWRNERVLGRWVWSTSNDGITAYDGFHAGATGASDQSFVGTMPRLARMGELERSDFLAAEARRFARENPGRVAELAVAKVARTWSPVPLSAEFGRPLYLAVAALYAVPFDLLVIAGLAAGRLPRRVKLFLLLPALYFTAVHAVSVGSLRYRVPAEPPLAVLAAAGAVRLMGTVRATKTEGDAPRGAPPSGS